MFAPEFLTSGSEPVAMLTLDMRSLDVFDKLRVQCTKGTSGSYVSGRISSPDI